MLFTFVDHALFSCMHGFSEVLANVAPWYGKFRFGYLGLLMFAGGIILLITGVIAVIRAPDSGQPSRRALLVHFFTLIAATALAFLVHNLTVLNVLVDLREYPAESTSDLMWALEIVPRHNWFSCAVIIAGALLGVVAAIRMK